MSPADAFAHKDICYILLQSRLIRFLRDSFVPVHEQKENKDEVAA